MADHCPREKDCGKNPSARTRCYLHLCNLIVKPGWVKILFCNPHIILYHLNGIKIKRDVIKIKRDVQSTPSPVCSLNDTTRRMDSPVCNKCRLQAWRLAVYIVVLSLSLLRANRRQADRIGLTGGALFRLTGVLFRLTWMQVCRSAVCICRTLETAWYTTSLLLASAFGGGFFGQYSYISN